MHPGSGTTQPAKVVVAATLLIPTDQAAPLEDIEAQAAAALREAGFFVSRLDAEFVEASDVV